MTKNTKADEHLVEHVDKTWRAGRDDKNDLVLRFGQDELSAMCDQLGSGGRDTVRLLVYCAREADFKRRSTS